MKRMTPESELARIFGMDARAFYAAVAAEAGRPQPVIPLATDAELDNEFFDAGVSNG